LLRIETVFKALNKARVDYLLIGGLASILYGVPRTTVDIDIALRPETGNITKAIKALRALGLVPDTERTDEILAAGGVSLSNDIELDLVTDTKGVDFNTAWTHRKTVEYDGTRVKVISKGDHIAMLKAVGRPKDLEDLEDLED
jgi:predicted nucleotidyltransferase